MRRLRVIALLTLCLTSSSAFAETGKAHLGKWGVDLSAMDRSIQPGDDFFNYVNGGWLKTAVIPAERSSTGTFQQLRILSEKRMKEIVAELTAKPHDTLTDEEKKLRDLHDGFLDQVQIEQRGLTPIQADLDYLASLKSHQDVARAMGLSTMPTSTPFGLGITFEDRRPDNYALDLTQSGLGLPDRDYYLSDDEKLTQTREAYRIYLARMLELAGYPDAQARADKVFALEVEIARLHWPIADRRDRDKVYNPVAISELKKLAPEYQWDVFLTTLGIPLEAPTGERQIILREKSALIALSKLFKATPVDVWRDYMIAHYLHVMAPYLPKAFDEADFDFYGKVLSGNEKQLDRATRAVQLLDKQLGEALGKIYVAKYFPPDSKAKAEALVINLRKAFDANIRTLDWMTEPTKEKALDKLNRFVAHIGYPDRWRDYSNFDVQRDDLVGNIKRGQFFEWDRQLKRLDAPVDRGEWHMTPQTVNAYYMPPLNEIVFPAAILQAPFFDPAADDAVNYGGIGMVIGHELSHGYDDQGSKVDGSGAFVNWWTPQDRKNFEERAGRLGQQYSAFEPLPGLKVNGNLTMGENIGDLSGAAISLQAYHLSLEGKEAPILDGFSGNQRFFLSYGQIWRSKYRENAVRQQILSDPHSPAQFRVIGVIRNMDEWYDAFDVTPQAKYYLPPEQRVRLW